MEAITIELILSIFNSRDSKKMREIKSQVINKLSTGETGELVLMSDEERQNAEENITRIIREDLSRGNESYLRYSNGKYSKRPSKRPIDSASNCNTTFIGMAGEAAVLSELLFNGYNANRMLIDDGVDIVASKDNTYFYVQVKTTYIRENRIYCHINERSYDRHIQSQMRYIIVARYKDGEADRNMFFVFNNNDIDRLIFGGFIKRGENNISIKIKFHERTGAPILYDGREETDASYHLNNFKLI